MVSPGRFLPSGEALLLTEIIHDLAYCETYSTYRNIFNDINKLIPYDYATSGLVTVDNEGAVQAYDLANINFTDNWIQSYNEQQIYAVDVTVKENFKHFKTQCWSETYKKHETPKKLLSFASAYNLTNGYSCGAKSFGMYKRPSMISFVWNFTKRCRYITSIIDQLTPHIHIALSNSFYNEALSINKSILTSREKEIMCWIRNGKSSWDISNILDISEATVNFHITNVLHKLEAVNRPQAVALALQHGIIDFD